MRHKSHTKVLKNGKIRKNSRNLQNKVLIRNSKEIMLFSIFRGIFDRFLGFRFVIHRFYAVCELRMVKRAIFRPIFLILATPEYSAFC